MDAPARVAENLDILDFTLSVSQLAEIDALDSDGLTGSHPADFNGQPPFPRSQNP